MPNLFRNNILGFIPDVDWLSVGFDVRRPNDPVDALFGDNRTGNLVAEWQSIAAEYKNPVMAQVGDCIRRQHALLEDRGVDTVLAWNRGNHFADSEERLAKGFAWCLGS